MTYPSRQLWALALAGVLNEMYSAHHDELGGWGDNEHTRPWCKNTLRDLYGVNSAPEFHDTIKWLLVGSRRRPNKPCPRSRPIRAWTIPSTRSRAPTERRSIGPG
jgi:hypothetical protein